MCMREPSNGLPIPEGPGSVSGAPNLPSGFTDTFTSRYVEAGGLRQHVVIGGGAPPPRGGAGRRAPAAAARARLAGELVRLAHADAGAGSGLRGHRSRPARHG